MMDAEDAQEDDLNRLLFEPNVSINGPEAMPMPLAGSRLRSSCSRGMPKG